MSDIVDEPAKPARQYPTKQQAQYENPSFAPKPSAPLQYPPSQYTVTQPYTYATMPPPPPTAPYGQQSQIPSWATPVYQTVQTQPQMRYVVQSQYPPQTQYPVMYPPQQQQQQQPSTGMAVAGGVLAGMLVADILDDNPF